MEIQEINPPIIPKSQIVLEIIFTISTIILYVIDIGTDINLAYVYYSGGWWFYCSLTVTLILTPSVITAMWYNYCNSQGKSACSQILEFFGTVCYITPVMAQLEYCHYFVSWVRSGGINNQAGDRVYVLIKEIGLIKIIEACLEAIPQAMTHTFVAYINLYNEQGPFRDTAGVGVVPWKAQVAVFFSITSTSLCLYFIYKTWINGSAYSEETSTGKMTLILLISGNFLILVGRIAAFVLLLVMSPPAFLNFVLYHWLLYVGISYRYDWEWVNEEAATVLERDQKERKLSQKTKHLIGSMAISIGYLVVPRGAINYLRLNTEKDKNIMLYYWLAYWVMFAENLGIFSVWLVVFSREESDQNGYLLGATNALYLAGMMLMWIHYRFYRNSEMRHLQNNISKRDEKLGKMYKWLGLSSMV